MFRHRIRRIQSRRALNDQPYRVGATFRIGPRRRWDSRPTIPLSGPMAVDEIIQRIERFRFANGPVHAKRSNRGYSLHHAETAVPIARLRPTGRDDRVEILFWSSWKQRWAPTGPFGRTILPLDEALTVIAQQAIFWTRV
jgi:hypothetical protein